MFNRFRKTRGTGRPEGYDEGRRLFEQGVAAANREEFQQAFAFYSKSIAVCPNPAPYLNRGRILVKKIRHKEALDDLLEAQRLDRKQASEFLSEIASDIKAVMPYLENYRNGMREKLIEDFKDHNESSFDLKYVAAKIFHASFKVPENALRPFGGPLAEYHFFNDLDNIARFEEVDTYPDAKHYLELYPEDFIAEKINGSVDIAAYSQAEALLNSFLCSYDEPDMRMLRRLILYSIHESLLIRDYGDQLWSMSNPQPEVIRSAAHLMPAEF